MKTNLIFLAVVFCIFTMILSVIPYDKQYPDFGIYLALALFYVWDIIKGTNES